MIELNAVSPEHINTTCTCVSNYNFVRQNIMQNAMQITRRKRLKTSHGTGDTKDGEDTRGDEETRYNEDIL